MRKTASTLFVAMLVAGWTIAANAETAASTTPSTAPVSATADQTTTAPVASGGGSTAAETTDNSVQAELNRVVCRKLPPPLGSRLGGRTVCMTQREWDEQRSGAQRELERMQRIPSARGPGAGG